MNILNNEHSQIMLYLIVNCVLLNITLPYNFEEFGVRDNEYENYIHKIKPLIDSMYSQIITTVNNF